jgi:hypothetical protein
MSKYRKPFLKCFSQAMAARLPQWRQGVCTPIFYARRDGTFSDQESYSKYGLSFHLVVEFSCKWAGAFTGDIIVSSSPEGYPPKTPAPPRWKKDIPELLEGNYRIGWFFADRDHWWHLMDEEAESKRFWESIPNLPQPVSTLERRRGDWYASSYDVPFEKVIDDAVQHFCDTFEQHVIPKLNARD